jgi:hypothetical protein
VDGQGWDVGFVWRVNWEMDALWWSIADEGHWTLSRNIWELAPRDTKELDSGQLCASIESPVLLQAFVFGSQVACSLNRGPVIVAPIPEDREPGHVGILANAREEHLRPNGATPYQKLAVWPLDAVDFLTTSQIGPTSAADQCIELEASRKVRRPEQQPVSPSSVLGRVRSSIVNAHPQSQGRRPKPQAPTQYLHLRR